MKQPISTYSSWARSIPQVIVVAVLTVFALYIFPQNKSTFALISSLSIFFVYTFIARYFISSEQRHGMSALAKGDFDTALNEFEKSFDFFSRNQWIDKYRSIILMTSSAWSYREMALMNIAATYSRKKDTKMYRESNKRLLKEYPNNQRAKDALAFLDALKNEA